MFEKKWIVLLLVLTLAGVGFVNAEASELLAPDVKLVDEYTIKGPQNFYNGYEPGDSKGNVNVVVEIPKGTTGKWEVSTNDGTIKWEFKKGKPREVTYLGGYPANYGSIPKTLLPKQYGGDGDPIDIVVIGEAIPRGSVIKVKLIGVLKISDEGEFDAKLLAVREGSSEYQVSSIDELNSKFDGAADSVASWFVDYKGPDSGIELEGIGSADEATNILLSSILAYKETNK